MTPDGTELKIWDFLVSGGAFMACIGLCSFVAVTVAIARAQALRWKAVFPPRMMAELQRLPEVLQAGKAVVLRQSLERQDNPMGRVALAAVSPDASSQEDAFTTTETKAREEIVRLETGMGVLEVVITIAPLLGLLGTVSGLVSVFATFGSEGGGDNPEKIAAGIATALNTTIAGLVVAVFTVLFHSYFTRKIERIAARMAVAASDTVHDFFRMGGPALYASSPAADPPADLQNATAGAEAAS